MPTSITAMQNDDFDLDYQQVFMRAPVGMCLSRDRVIQLANTALETMFGYAEGALNQASFEHLYPSAEEFERTGRRLLELLKPDSFYYDERIMKRRSGELFWCHVVGRMLSESSPHAAVIWTFEDLSTRRPVASGLSAREREIAALVAEGRTSKVIARQLGLSPRTVDMFRARLMKKFGVATSSALIHRLMSFTPSQD
jgi:PAS domain S-box-containing protein